MKPLAITAEISAVVADFKRSERRGAEIGSAYMHDVRLAILVTHWEHVRNVPTKQEIGLGGHADWWEALWGNCITDYDQICVMLDCDLNEAIKLVDRAAELRLLYPDGSVNQMALLLARGLTATQVGREEELEENPEGK